MSGTGLENAGYLPGEGNIFWKPRSGSATFSMPQVSSLVVKVLLLVLVLCVVAVVGLAIAVVVMQYEVRHVRTQATDASGRSNGGSGGGSGPNLGEVICLTPECVTAAGRILKHMDQSVHPCDDFYQFACGGWMSSRVIPGDKSSLSIFGEVRDDIQIKLKVLLDKDLSAIIDALPEAIKAKNLYESCLNEDLLNSRGDQIFKDYIRREFGEWPLISLAWDESTFDLTDLLVAFRSHGISAIVSFWVGEDSKNVGTRRLEIDQAVFGMPGRKYYLVPRNDTMLTAYEDYMFNVANQLGLADPTTARQQVADVVDLEIELAKINVPSEDRRDSEDQYNPMTLRELHGNYSQEFVDWRRFFHGVTSPPEIGITDLTDDEVIINNSPAYYNNYTTVLRNTSKRTITNYLFWRFAMSFAPVLTDPYREFREKYFKVLYGTSSSKPRSLKCASYTAGVMSDLVGRIFVTKHFDIESRDTVLGMIEDLQVSFNELLDKVDWMDDETKVVAREKNDAMKSKIGFSDRLFNATYFEITYRNISYDSDKYFENNLHMKKVWFEESMRKLRKPVDKGEWYMSPQTVNAYYSFMRNEMVFPAGILQPPYFSKHYPRSLNFGGIGMVMGHEITHGFDDQGRQYDMSGELRQWWADSAVEKFKAKAQCIVDQYSNYTMEEAGLNLNGINTQGENIADNGAIKQSFRAYRNWVRAQGKEEPALPGLEQYTHDQLFFINFGQIWCSMYREESAISRVRTGVHSPGRFRVIGPAQNSPDFTKAFDCPRTSYMNPDNRCAVW